MREGFVYNYDLCVACNACAAACYLENNGQMPWRKVLSDNPLACPGLPVHNLSLACNHCDNPVCLYSCPAGAYYTDSETGAVLLDSDRCIGCNYCYWNCPYDAPQYNRGKGIMEKCHLCYERIKENILPACTSACPTGALSFGPVGDDNGKILNMPDNELKPALKLTDPEDLKNEPIIIPEPGETKDKVRRAGKKLKPGHEWPLIIFSYLSSLLLALLFADWSGSVTINPYLFTGLLLLNGSISLFHLGKPARFYRSVINLKTSPLSREIIAYALFAAFSFVAVFIEREVFWLLAFLSALFLLVSIDSVYAYSDKSYRIRYHSSQTFLTGLMMASLLINEALPFIFILLVRVIGLLVSRFGRSETISVRLFTIVYILFMSFMAYRLTDSSMAVFPALIIAYFLFEFAARIIFYFDFSPISIRFEFQKNNNYKEKHEKQAG